MTNMETERILFRPWCDSDAETLFKYASDPEVGPRAGWPPHKSVEESLEIIRTIFHSDHIWAIVLKDAGGDACVPTTVGRDACVPTTAGEDACAPSGEPIGCMGYMVHGESNIDIGENDAEVGYWIARPYWNRGICTEALRLLIDYCFNVKGFHTLWADYFPDNPASGKVMEHCGFHDTGLVNRCSRLQLGSDRPVKIMRLKNNGVKGIERN